LHHQTGTPISDTENNNDLYHIKNQAIMETKELVLKAMHEAGKPVSAGEVTKSAGLDRKEVDKAFAELKKEGAITSPVRCKWEPAK
jgi:DNA-binding transcriptional regulator YhcF (GntR family)